jgi:maleylpyruvate isomerase
MKLYSARLSLFAACVRIAIYRKGLGIAVVPPPCEGLKSAAYLAVSPMGQIPALQLENGSVIPDSGVIPENLEDAFPTPSLRSDRREDLARARLFMRIPDVQFNSAPRMLIGMRNPADRKPDLVAAAMENIERALDNVQHFLDDGDGPWAVGGKASVADCAIVPVLNVISLVARVYDRADVLESRPRLNRYWRAAQAEAINARVIGERLAAVARS